jgi:hypothetical protein
MIASRDVERPFGRLSLASLGVGALEATAWIALLVATALTRLLLLGNPPLNLDEARRAMEAYTLYTQGRVIYEGASILTNLTSVVFILFGDGDIQARLVPAVCGVALVATPLLLRPVIPGYWSLAAAGMLAASTIVLTASRSVSPTVPMLLCVMLAAIGAWRFGRDSQPVWLTVACTAVLVGLGLDPSFALALAGVVLAFAISEGDLTGRTTWWPPVRQHAPRALAIAAGVALLLETRLGTSPSGLQAGVIDPLWRWYSDVARGAGLTAPLLVGLLDGAIMCLALVGLLEFRARPRVVRFLGTWLIVALTLASLMRMPDHRYLAPAVLPAALLAGFGLLRLASWIQEGGTTRAIVIGLIGLVPVITTAFQINAGLRSGVSPWGAATVVLIGGLILVGLLAFNVLRGLELGAAIATWALVLLAVGAIAGGSRGLEARGEPRGQLIESTVVTADVDMVRQVTLKWFRADPAGVILVDAPLRPVLGWALRDVPTIRYDAAARELPQARLLADAPSQIGPEFEAVRILGGYAADWSSLSLQASRIWQWMVHRESLVTLRPYAIVVVQPAGR